MVLFDVPVTSDDQFLPELLWNSSETKRKNGQKKWGNIPYFISRKQKWQLDLKEALWKGTFWHIQDAGTSAEHDNYPKGTCCVHVQIKNIRSHIFILVIHCFSSFSAGQLFTSNVGSPAWPKSAVLPTPGYQYHTISKREKKEVHPEKLWIPPPWKSSRPGWIELWASWANGMCPCPWQAGLIFKALPVQTFPWFYDSVILWF